MSYAGNWFGSGQIPDRAVQSGQVSRFGSIDPDEGGNTARHQIYAQYRLWPTPNSELTVLAYAGLYRFNLFSNFTLFLRDPDNGDEIEQVDRRIFYGGRFATGSCTSSGPWRSTRPSAATRAATTSTASSGTRCTAGSSRPCATTTCTRR